MLPIRFAHLHSGPLHCCTFVLPRYLALHPVPVTIPSFYLFARHSGMSYSDDFSFPLFPLSRTFFLVPFSYLLSCTFLVPTFLSILFSALLLQTISIPVNPLFSTHSFLGPIPLYRPLFTLHFPFFSSTRYILFFLLSPFFYRLFTFRYHPFFSTYSSVSPVQIIPPTFPFSYLSFPFGTM